MPELPEVETYARLLRPDLVGTTIDLAEVRWRRTIAQPAARRFKSEIQGQHILDVRRRAKFLVVQLTSSALLFHLRMSGDLRVEHGPFKPQKHDRLILRLSPGAAPDPAGKPGEPISALVFNDTRKFGRVWLTADADDVTRDLGPEPLDPSFTARQLYERLHQEVIGLRQACRLLGWGLLALGLMTSAGATVAHLGVSLPLSELATRPGMLIGMTAAMFGGALMAVGRGWLIRRRPAPHR